MRGVAAVGRDDAGARPGAALQRVLRAAALLVTALLAGCAVPGDSASADAGGAARERPTASDQTDAERRSRVRLELASAYFGRGQFETALDEVKLSIAANPRLAAAYDLRGLIYAGLGEDGLADDSFRRALQLDARDADAMHNYGWFLCQRKRFDDASVQFAQALAQPQYAGVARTLLARGVCQARAGQWLEAEGSLLRAYEIDPANPSTAVNLAEVLYRRADFERARFYIRRVNAAEGASNAQTLWLAARIEHRLANAAGVREFGAQLKARFPQSPQALQFEQGRFDE